MVASLLLPEQLSACASVPCTARPSPTRVIDIREEEGWRLFMRATSPSSLQFGAMVQPAMWLNVQALARHQLLARPPSTWRACPHAGLPT